MRSADSHQQGWLYMSIYIYSDLFVETFWRREKNKRAHPLYTGVKYTHHLITPQITRAGLTARARTPQNKGEKKPFTIETIAITNVEDEGKIESIHIQYRTLKKRRACLVQIDEKQNTRQSSSGIHVFHWYI